MKKIAFKLAAIAIGATMLSSAYAANTGNVKAVATAKTFTTAVFGQSTALTVDLWKLDGNTLVFCIEPAISLNANAVYGTTGTSYSGFSDNVKSLYSLYYGSVVDTTSQAAANGAGLSFQLALWELNNDKSSATNPDLFSGDLAINTKKTYAFAGSQKVVEDAAAMIAAAKAGAGAIENDYTFTQYSYAGSQTLVGATLVSAVPEPSTYAMLGLGLALVGFTARRRKQG